MRIKISIILGVAFLVFLSACGQREEIKETSQGIAPSVSITKTEDGWSLYEISSEGFALALPPDWRQFNMDPATFDATMKATLRTDPQLKTLLGNLRLQIKSGVKFFGVDEATIHSGFATNVNILTVRSGGSLDAAVADTLKELGRQAAIAKPIKQERIKVLAGDCERFRYNLTMKGPMGKPIILSINQLLVTRGEMGNVITMTTLPEQEAKYADIFERIAQSFRYTR